MSKSTESVNRQPVGLSHIVVRWKFPGAEQEEHHLIYDAVELGEAVCRTRAAARIAAAKAAGATITRYRAYSAGGVTFDIE